MAWCGERIALGKPDTPALAFPVEDDGIDVRAPIAGVVAGLRRAENDVCVFRPVDCPLVGEPELRALAAAHKRRLARGELALLDALGELETALVDLDPERLVNVNTADDLRGLGP